MVQERQRKVLIAGGGPVGALTALALFRRGWSVEVWESRNDPRGKKERIENLRSINLAISARGLEALRSVDPSLAEQFLDEAIPMKGRMIHHPATSGSVVEREESQVYDTKRGQCINSISRPILNQRLLEALPEGIQIRFETKLDKVDFRRRMAWGKYSGKGKKRPGEEDDDGAIASTKGTKVDEGGVDIEGTAFDLIIGADGSWSKVRSEMMRVERIDFSQSFIPHAYIELHLPPSASHEGNFALDKNHLHIWPRHAFMLIALPNKDGSFTLTLFLPFASLENIKTRDDARKFFRDNFPDVLTLVGEELLDDFEKNPRGNLVTINVSPVSWESHGILLGDASHSMVPFYGQGLNCGLEDVRVLNSYLEQHNVSATTTTPIGETDPVLAKALQAYSEDRKADLEAICELAMQNYTEMRSSVLSPLYLLRRTLDSILSSLVPSRPTSSLSLTNPFPTERVSGWTSLYEMVTFRPDVGYSEALRRERWQKGVIGWMVWGSGVGVLGGVGGVGLWATRKYLERRR